MKRILLFVLLALFLCSFFLGCSGGGGASADLKATPTPTPTPSPTPAPTPNPTPAAAAQTNYSTSVTPVMSKGIVASVGGTVAVTDTNSSLSGVSLSIPAGALKSSATIMVGMVNNPPILPIGLNHVIAPIDFGPDGTIFSTSATLKIPFSDLELSQAGVSSKTDLKLYVFDKKTKTWSEGKILSIDTLNNFVTAQVDHFSFYSLVGLSGTPPQDLGRPQAGDLLFTLSTYDGGKTSGWATGHVGIFTDEVLLSDAQKKFASPDAVRCGMLNTVEALLGGVQLSYYKIPNTVQSCEVSDTFSGSATFMGSRQISGYNLTLDQRKTIVDYVIQQAGKPYAYSLVVGDVYGLLPGQNVEGPEKFDCVGLAQKAYMVAGINGGDGIVTSLENKFPIPPAELYSKTEPASGVNTGPVIKSATITPSSGTATTNVLCQISVSHPYGLSYIDSVRYVTDDGYVNPNININDAGVDGDLKAGDGIYTAAGTAGGDPTKGSIGLTFTVTDKGGKSASIRLVYTYTSGAIKSLKSTGDQSSSQKGSWAR